MLTDSVNGSGPDRVKSAAFVGISFWIKLSDKADLNVSSAITVTVLDFLLQLSLSNLLSSTRLTFLSPFRRVEQWEVTWHS